MLASDIKNQIKSILEELAKNETLKDVKVFDFKKDNIFDLDLSRFPTAILMPPSIEGGELTNRDNLRTHTFEIVIISNREDLDSEITIEDLIETILNKFDNDPTLGGKADGGVLPSSSRPEALASLGHNYIVFSIFIQAKAVKNLTF